MDARERARLEVVRRATDSLRFRDFRTSLRDDDGSGETAILAALYDDPISIFFNVAEDLGTGFLVTSTPTGGLAILHFTPSQNDAVSTPDEDECPLHPDSEVGMLVEYVSKVRGPVRCSLYCPECDIELVDEGTAVEVPA